MNDRELLILAAKAAGIYATSLDDYSDDEGLYLEGQRSPDNSSFWNPLKSDGDALRLAVKLGLHVQIDFDDPDCKCVYVYSASPQTVEEPEGEDRYAATRRAIVRAAGSLAGAGGGEK